MIHLREPGCRMLAALAAVPELAKIARIVLDQHEPTVDTMDVPVTVPADQFGAVAVFAEFGLEIFLQMEARHAVPETKS